MLREALRTAGVGLVSALEQRCTMTQGHGCEGLEIKLSRLGGRTAPRCADQGGGICLVPRRPLPKTRKEIRKHSTDEGNNYAETNHYEPEISPRLFLFELLGILAPAKVVGRIKADANLDAE